MTYDQKYELGLELAESWVNGNHSDVIAEVLKLKKKDAIFVAFAISENLEDADFAEFLGRFTGR